MFKMNHPHACSLGADQEIDYNVEDFTTIGAIYGVVFNTVGGGVRVGCCSALFEAIAHGRNLIRDAAKWIGSAQDVSVSPCRITPTDRDNRA